MAERYDSEVDKEVVPEKEPQVYTQMESLEQNIDILNFKVGVLEDRITQILSPRNMAITEENKEQELVPLATYIRTGNKKLSDIINRIDAITNAIEL